MKINEIFLTVQGESVNTMAINKFGTGVPTIFVRTNNCSIQCTYCDTRYTWDGSQKEKGKEMNPEEIIQEVQKVGDPYKVVCISGGEPELQPVGEMHQLISGLKELGYTVSAEASGTADRDFFHLADSVIMDIKGPSAGAKAMERTKHCMEYVKTLKCFDQLKFLVKDRNDFDWMMSWLEKSGVNDYDSTIRPQILISPEFDDDGNNNAADVVKWMLDAKLNAILNFQVHKIIWDISAREV